jgi:hypothetical protein
LRNWKSACQLAIVASTLLAVACGGDSSPTPTPVAPTPVNPRLTAPTLDFPGDDEQLGTLRPTLVVKNGTSDQNGTRTYEFQISDSGSFVSTTTSLIASYYVVVNQTGVAEGADGKTQFTPAQDLQPTTRLYWRARLVQGSTVSEWSSTGKFKTKLVGFLRAGELYDPLIHGETVGERVGPTSFIPGKGIQLDSNAGYVKYLLPQTVSSGEFSMDVEGLRANAPGDKSKVFGMQEGQTDFITNRYRVDIQYRGTTGFPPNAIQWRVLYGSADDLDVRYEPDTAKRLASVFLLNGSTTYHWRATWGSDFRLVVKEGGINGSPIYDYGLPTPEGTYSPSPHYVYLGAPLGRSGIESASIPGTIYRNVWLGSRPRPESLGSALEPSR